MMAEFLILMHDDVTEPVQNEAWPEWFEQMNKVGAFRGGSAIGEGHSLRKAGATAAMSSLFGYVKLDAADAEEVQNFLNGNPVFEAGGTIEIRELPVTS